MRAHAPLARGLALAEDGAVAVRMPGFGWILRGAGEQGFAYACDALLAVDPAAGELPMAYRGDGGLLVGTRTGLRLFDGHGCPRPAIESGELGTLPIAGVTVAGSEVAYAAVSGALAALYRSADGGRSWQRGAELASDEPLGALLAHAGDPQRVYASVTLAGGRSALLRSSDGGASVTRSEQARALTLLHVGGEPEQWWARAPAQDGKRGVEILRAESADGPWRALLRVNFFGGFTRDADGALWVGDEGGGVFRSTDGETFVEVAPAQAVACLGIAQGALWACTPGTAQQRALAVARTSMESGAAGPELAFDDVVAFAQVDRMVECGAELEVGVVCAAGWNEWRIDVRGSGGVPVPGPPAPSDAGATADGAAGDRPTPEADASMPAMASPGQSGEGSCAAPVAARANDTRQAWWLVLTAWLLRRRRAARTTRSGGLTR